jgi:hypothetical protein
MGDGGNECDWSRCLGAASAEVVELQPEVSRGSLPFRILLPTSNSSTASITSNTKSSYLPNWVYSSKLIQMQYYLGMSFEDMRIKHYLAKVNSGSCTKYHLRLQYPFTEADDEPAAVTNMSEIP